MNFYEKLVWMILYMVMATLIFSFLQKITGLFRNVSRPLQLDINPLVIPISQYPTICFADFGWTCLGTLVTFLVVLTVNIIELIAACLNNRVPPSRRNEDAKPLSLVIPLPQITPTVIRPADWLILVVANLVIVLMISIVYMIEDCRRVKPMSQITLYIANQLPPRFPARNTSKTRRRGSPRGLRI